jgi:hypothetical protein
MGNPEWFLIWLQMWETKTLLQHVLDMVAGMAGVLVYASIILNDIHMPQYDSKKKILKLGIFGLLWTGAIAGLLVDYSPPLSVVGGLISVTTVELLTRIVIPAFVTGIVVKIRGEK